MERETLTAMLGQGMSVEKIARQFGRHPSTISYWMAKYGLQAPNRDRHAAKGGIEEDELRALVDAGMSIAQMSEILNRGKATIRYWLRKYGLSTKAVGRVQAVRDARDAGMLTLRRECPRHGDTDFVIEGRGYYRCTQCRSEGVARKRRQLKATLVREAGGACRLCGYDRCAGALEFHHLDPAQKRLGISEGGLSLSIDVLRAEVAKCVLLCSNCHAEVENGLTRIVETRETATSTFCVK